MEQSKLQNKARKPWVAGLFTFFSIGLGHIYTGEAKRGIMLFLGQGFLLLLVPLLLVTSPIIALVCLLTCGFAYFIFCFLDSIKCARSNNMKYQLKKYNKWYVYFSYWVLMSLILQPIVEAGIKGNVVQAYKIPSGAMMPTLLIGDQILVNKYVYKKQTPQRGDIAVFEFPKDPTTDYIKRVIGIGGDLVEIKDKKLFVNGVLQNETFVIHTGKHFISSNIPRDNFGPYTVPLNTLFFMGDNRDNSYDSRFWGIVDNEKVKGKAICFYWSWDKDSSKIRWDRIGQSIK